MPGTLRYLSPDGDVLAQVFTRGRHSGLPHHFVEADRLDLRIDSVLDEAVKQSSSISHPSIPSAFTKAWVIGRTFRDSGLLEDEAISGEDPEFIWEVLANKAAMSLRNDGSPETRWHDLRPRLEPVVSSPVQSQRTRKADHWARCVWLAEQSHAEAAETLGGSMGNVCTLYDRPSLRPLVLRQALHHWLTQITTEDAERVIKPRSFDELVRQLGRRWPGRGQRSALQPVHYRLEDLVDEINQCIDLQLILVKSTKAPTTVG